MDINQTLVARNGVHGDFFAGAEFGQSVEKLMKATPNWEHLSPGQVDALRVITQKIARIMFGDPNFADHWHDIAGYSTIIDKHLIAGAKVTAIQTECLALGKLANDLDDLADELEGKQPTHTHGLSPALQQLVSPQPSAADQSERHFRERD